MLKSEYGKINWLVGSLGKLSSSIDGALQVPPCLGLITLPYAVNLRLLTPLRFSIYQVCLVAY